MIPKHLRISRDVFKKAERGIRRETTNFSLRVTPSRTGGCAAVVSKKVAKKSVDRHLLKRRILSVLRPYCTKEETRIVYARSGAQKLSFKALKEELTPLLNSNNRVG